MHSFSFSSSPPPPPPGDSRCIHTHTHSPGCVNSWEAGLCNEVAATTPAPSPGLQSPERREETRGRGSGVGGWDCKGGRRPGDAPDRALLGGAGGNVLGRLGRAHTPPLHPAPPGWAGQQAARALPQARGLGAQGGGGGKAPVTSGSRGSGREGRGSGGETTADWCARIIHTTQWIASSRRPRARTSGLRTGCWQRPPRSRLYPRWVSPSHSTL